MEKRKPKRMALSIITFLLSCVLCMASYAGTVIDPSALSGNAASGGSFMGSGGSSGDLSENYGRYMQYPQNCGYRIAVVDTQGYAVTNIIDAVNYCPKDLVENGGGSYTMDANGGDVTDIRANYNQYEKYVGMLEPSDGGKNTNFYYSVGVKTEPYGKGERFTRGITTGLGKYTSEVYGGTVNAYMYPISVLRDCIYANAVTAAAAGDPPLPAPDISLFQFPLPITMVSSRNSWGVIANGGRLKAMLDAHVDPADETSTTLSSLLIQSYVPRYNGRGDLEGGETRPLFEFIDGVPAKEKMYTTKSDGSAYSIVDAIKEYDYKVVVEPIFWHVMILDEYDPAAASHVSAVGQTRYVLYGTASYMLGDTFKELTEDTGFDALVLNHAVSDWSNICAGFGWSTLYTGLTTLEVEREDPELQIRIPALETVGDTPYYNLASTAVEDNYRHSGYGCFIYDAEGLFGDPEGTHTWDSENYPEGDAYKPEAAPLVPTEEQGTGKSKQNIIVKYYAHKTDSGYTYINNFNRDNTISPIDIEDEPKFKVDGRFDPIVSI